MNKKYHKLWILLREKLTRMENEEATLTIEKEDYHRILTSMAELEASEFLEE